MITEDKVLETLERFEISEDDLETWEAELGLDIPVDSYGEKQYSPLHINLFKNIRKHLTLGRSLAEIKRMIVLPATSENRNELIDIQATPTATMPKPQLEIATSMAQQAEIKQTLGTRSKPTSLSQRLMEQLKPALAEKQAREMATALEAPITVELETLPPAELNNSVETPLADLPTVEDAPLREISPETLAFTAPDIDPTTPPLAVVSLSKRSQGNLKRFASPAPKLATSAVNNPSGANAGLLALVDKLMSEKDTLQSTIAQLERQNAHLREANTMMQARVRELRLEAEEAHHKLTSDEHLKLIQDKSQLQKQAIEAEQRAIEAEKALDSVNQQIHELNLLIAQSVDPRQFTGNWLERATLIGIEFDNFGINIEDTRNRLFRITHPPERCFGHTAVIETTYDYQTNALWKRKETMVLNLTSATQLDGHLTIEYVLDGTPVARAAYTLHCSRNA